MADMRILLIDDSPDDRELIVRTLQRSEHWAGSVLLEAESGSDGLGLLDEGTFDCALLDYSMPGSDGLEILNEIQLRHPDLAVVMITGEGSEKIAAQAFKTGAADYVTKSDISVETLVSAIASARQSKREERDVLRRANHDELTGLPNRRAFNERLGHVMERSFRGRQPFGVVFMDLNKFKPINDNYGHEIGDLVLQDVARRLSASLRSGDMLARIGGDEFVAILENLGENDEEGARIAVDRLRAAVEDRPIEIQGESLNVGISIGLALFPRMADDVDGLLRRADRDMYRAKHSMDSLPGDFTSAVRTINN